MKHAAVKPSSAAKSTASRVVATIALATAATAVASPAMAHEGGGRSGDDGHSAGYDGRDRGPSGYDGRDGGRQGDEAPRSYEPAAYSEPNYDLPQYGSQQGDCDRSEARTEHQTQGGWGEDDREQARAAIREYVQEAGAAAPAAEAEPVRTVTQRVAAPEAEIEAATETVEAEATVPAARATPVATTPSEPVAVQAPGEQWEGGPTAADTAGAELTAYVPGAQDVSALAEATLDAPVRLATTGAEAAALTGAAGALVIGGAGSLLVARRSRVRV
jgi:hypothetical protein